MPRVNLGKDPSVKARREILYERYGGYMSIASVMTELGCVSRPTAMKFLSGLPFYNLTGRKLYDIGDIADRIESCRNERG